MLSVAVVSVFVKVSLSLSATSIYLDQAHAQPFMATTTLSAVSAAEASINIFHAVVQIDDTKVKVIPLTVIVSAAVGLVASHRLTLEGRFCDIYVLIPIKFHTYPFLSVASAVLNPSVMKSC